MSPRLRFEGVEASVFPLQQGARCSVNLNEHPFPSLSLASLSIKAWRTVALPVVTLRRSANHALRDDSR